MKHHLTAFIIGLLIFAVSIPAVYVVVFAVAFAWHFLDTNGDVAAMVFFTTLGLACSYELGLKVLDHRNSRRLDTETID